MPCVTEVAKKRRVGCSMSRFHSFPQGKSKWMPELSTHKLHILTQQNDTMARQVYDS